jgi:hypothetical protein
MIFLSFLFDLAHSTEVVGTLHEKTPRAGAGFPVH